MRLIDADALIKERAEEMWQDRCDHMVVRVKNLETFPTVDAVEVVHGDWIDGRPFVNSRWKVCSACHQTAPEPHGGYNYCPYCGAKMDGGEEMNEP